MTPPGAEITLRQPAGRTLILVMETELTGGRGAPDWLGAAHRAIREELRLFLSIVLAVSLRPALFARQWRERQRETLNPLAFLGTSLAFSSPPALIVAHFAGLEQSDGSLWQAFLSDQVAPYLQYVLLGVFAHGVLRLLGGRERLLATVGIALYAGGGPAMVVDLLALPADVALARLVASPESHTGLALQGLTVTSMGAANAAFLITFAGGLAGLHGLRLWRPVVALAFAYLLLVAVRLAFFTVVLRMS
jgi:hypothetical protein